MSSSVKRTNLLPALLLIAGVVAIVAVASIFAFRPADDIIQGQAEADDYRISSKVPGRVLSLRVKEGSHVRAGDTLAVLEAPDIEAKRAQAEAAAAAAAAQNRKAGRSARQEQVTAAYEMWQKAVAGLDIAEKSYQRVARLYEQGVVSAQKYDEAAAQRQAAQATERAARAQYDMALSGAEREDREAAAALAAQARGAVAEVDAYLDETILVAPLDGEVSEIFVQPGELVGTGAPIMNVTLTDSMWVTFNVREDRLARFAMDTTLQATIPALDGRSVSLTVYYMKDLGSYAAWKATKSMGQFDMKTFEVKASPSEPVAGLRPGMSVLVE